MLRIYPICRAVTQQRIRKFAGYKGVRQLAILRADGDEGAALVEFALMLPILMMVLLGMFNLGVMLNQYLQLTNAVGIGGQALAVARGNTTNPCSLVFSAVENAAPTLTPSQLSFNLTLNGTAFGPYAGNNATGCSSSSTTTGAAGDLVAGQSITLTVTYPCTLGVWGNTNILPGCTLKAQITEESQ